MRKRSDVNERNGKDAGCARVRSRVFMHGHTTCRMDVAGPCMNFYAPLCTRAAGMCYKDPTLTEEDKKWNGKIEEGSDDEQVRVSRQQHCHRGAYIHPG